MTPILTQTSARHPKTSSRPPQTLSRHPRYRRFPVLESTERKGNIWQLNLTNIIQLISIYMTSTSTPDICQTPLDIFQTPQTLSRHPGYRCFRVREGTGTSTEDCPLEVPVPSLTRKHLYLWCLDNVWCVWMMSKGVWQMSGVVWVSNELKTV